MATLIRNAFVQAPEPLGVRDILIAGGRIEALAEPGALRLAGAPVEEVDAGGRLVLPGLVDGHVHILGGGGEGGPATRAPEIRVEEIAASGVTTVIGCLGTDSVTRHPSSLLAKARALEAEGISACIFVGAYDVPPPTLTGSVRSDIALIDQVIGAGEVAVSDHRSSQPSFEEIARLAAECRVGGLLGGKAGVLHLHLGDGPRGLGLLFRLIAETEIPATQIMPTHVNRNAELFEEAMAWAGRGGSFDLTSGPEPDPESGELSVEKSVGLCLERGVPLARVTVSSDGNGSLPVFDRAGNLTHLTVASPRDFLRSFQSLLRRRIVEPADAARLFSSNAASFYKLRAKGAVEPGRDADLILLDRDYELVDVWARGRRLVAGGRVVVRGTFGPAGAGN